MADYFQEIKDQLNGLFKVYSVDHIFKTYDHLVTQYVLDECKKYLVNDDFYLKMHDHDKSDVVDIVVVTEGKEVASITITKEKVKELEEDNLPD